MHRKKINVAGDSSRDTSDEARQKVSHVYTRAGLIEESTVLKSKIDKKRTARRGHERKRARG